VPPLLAHEPRNAHAVALAKHGAAVRAERGRRKRLAVMHALRAELGLPSLE
jgi:hypothetical protein